MSLINIPCTKDTYVDYYNTTANNSALPLLKTWYWGNTDALPHYHSAILQFSVPSLIAFKKINSVKLSYKIAFPEMNVFNAVGYRVLSTAQDISLMNWNTIRNYGVYGTQTIVNYGSNNQDAGSERYIEEDITALFKNGIVSDLFTLSVNVSSVGDTAYIPSMESASAPIITVNYEDVPPNAPMLTYPLNVFVDSDSEINLAWSFTSQSGAGQMGYEVGYKKSDVAEWTIASILSAVSSYKIPSNTFEPGLIDWRVKVTDTAYLTSGFSYGQFTVKGKPPVPVITNIKNDSLTEISWNTTDQNAYEVEIKKDGVSIYSDKKNTVESVLKPSIFLKNGNYELLLRVMNSFNYWSDFASKAFTISATAPTKPTISVSVNKATVLIGVGYSTSEAFLYRVEDGKEKCIAKLTGTSYEDKAITHDKQCSYFLRVHDGGYADSDKVNALAKIEHFILTAGLHEVNIKRCEDVFMPYTESISKESVLVNYSGRENPVNEVGEHIRLAVARRCFVTEAQYKVLNDIFFSSDVVLYRDDRSRKIYCELSGIRIVNSVLDTGYTLDISLTQIDYSEEVEIYAET